MPAYTPDFATFRQLADGAGFVPVFRRLVSDTLTPVSAYCRLQDDENSFLFESVVGGERVGRYSFLGAGPFLHIDAFERERGEILLENQTRDAMGLPTFFHKWD